MSLLRFEGRVASPARQVVLLIAVLACTTLLPYLFPSPMALSLSHVTHFNNKVCALVFAAGGLVYAFLTAGRHGDAEEASADRAVSYLSLALALALVAVLCWAHLFDAVVHVDGPEAIYNVNRLQMLVAGKHLYRDFEYAYGPFQLVVPAALHRWLGITAYAAHYIWWVVQWLGGIVLTWWVVRMLAFPIRHRTIFFWGLVLAQLGNLDNEGIAYTPIRMMGAAFLLMVAHASWQQRHNPWLTTLTGILCINIAASVSPDQGMGVAAGLIGWLWLRWIASRTRQSILMAIAITMATAALFGYAEAAGYFHTTREFSLGAFNFPLTPSLYAFVILICYVFSTVAGHNAIRARSMDTQAVPLALGGLAMLPVALGRSDLGHMQLASPALVLGIAYIQAHAQIRRPWNLAYLLLFLVPGIPGACYSQLPRIQTALEAHAHARRVLERQKQSRQPSTAASRKTIAYSPLQQGQQPGDPHRQVILLAPCPILYRVIDVTPPIGGTAGQSCMSVGYYAGLYNVFTPGAVAEKIAGLEERPRQPLLLWDYPLERQFGTIEDDPRTARAYQMGLVTPPRRREAFTYAALRDYVAQNYVSDRDPSPPYRVWRPKVP